MQQGLCVTAGLCETILAANTYPEGGSTAERYEEAAEVRDEIKNII